MKILKVILTTISLVIISSLLVSCSEKKNMDLLISKYFENGQIEKNMIEIYNSSENEIDLNNYNLAIYRNGNLLEKSIIKFDNKKLPSKGFLLVANTKHYMEKFPEIFKNKELVISSDLVYNGDDPIAIEKENKIVDIIGIHSKGIYSYGKNTSLIRNKDMYYSTAKYDVPKFIGFVPEYFNTLSKIDETADIKIVEKGPRFNKEYLKIPYYKTSSTNTKLGLGGAAKAKVTRYVDGDTTEFLIDADYGKENKLNPELANSTFKARYYFINTPESTKLGGADAFGKWATLTTNELLERAEKNGTLYVQSIDNDHLEDTYGRYLTLVWADGYLINWVLVRDSLSAYKESDPNEINSKAKSGIIQYKNILVSYYLKYAEYLAEKSKRRVHGTESDPMFDYKNKQFKDNYKKYFKPTYKKYLYYEKNLEEYSEPLDFLLKDYHDVNKKELKKLVDEVEKITKEEKYSTYYLKDLKTRLEKQYTISKYILSNNYIDQSLVDEVKNKLETELTYFKDSHIKKHPKKELDEKIKEAETIKNDDKYSKKYPESNRKDFEKYLEEAQKVFKLADPFKIEIEDALSLLKLKIESLKLSEIKGSK